MLVCSMYSAVPAVAGAETERERERESVCVWRRQCRRKMKLWKVMLPVLAGHAACVIPSRSFAGSGGHGHIRGAKICPTSSTPNLPIPAAMAKHGWLAVHVGDA